MKHLSFVFLLVLLTSISCKCQKNTVNDTKTQAQTQAVKQDPVDGVPLNTKPEDGVKGAEVKELLTTPKQQNETHMIEYFANARGYFIDIRYSNNTLSFAKDRDNVEKRQQVTLSKADITELNTLLNDFDPELLATLKAPTDQRLYDGAAHANVLIVKKGVRYDGLGFDHGYPPKPLEKLVTKLISLCENKK